MTPSVYKNRINFFTSIVLPSLLAVILFIATLFYLVIPRFETAMLDRKREMITELTNAATSILAKYHKDELEGILTREEAQQTSISRIQYLRYGEENKDYFWITDMNPVMIVHPYRPELNGQKLNNYKDGHGKRLFMEFVKVVEEQEHGFVDYMWQWKDDSSLIVPKLSYVQGFEPWGWIIGTGIYIEDVKAEIAELSKAFTRISLIISFIIIIILFYIGKQSFSIENKRRRAEEELNHTKEKYRSLVEASTEGLIMYMDGEISFVNAIFEKMSGINAEEVVRKDINDIIEIPEDIKAKIAGNNYDFSQVSVESTVFGNFGDKLDVVLNIMPLVFYGREAVIFSIKDISSDKLIKEELFQSKDKFQSLMDNLNQGIFRTSLDLKGKFIEANKTTINILGYESFSEISDKYILDFFIEVEDKKYFRKNLLEKGFVKNQIVKLQKKSGEQILAAVSLVVINDNGKPKFCDGLIIDVTFQKGSDKLAETVNSSFTSFSQLIYQPIKDLGKEVLFCDHNTSIKAVVNQMTKNDSEAILIKGPSAEVLGYIDDKILRMRTYNNEIDPETAKCYEIMSSPVPSISESNMLLEALNIMKSLSIDFLFMRNKEGIYTSFISRKDLLTLEEFLPVSLVNSINTCDSVRELKGIRDSYIQNLIPIIKSGTQSSVIFRNISLLSDLLSRQIIKLSIEHLGQPPLPFAFISMGSEGRQEQSLKTDQDNALIYQDPENDSEKEVAEEYFKKFSEMVCTRLDQVGYNFCVGEVMAMNSKWRQPLSTWKTYFKNWIHNGKVQDLLDICIFFDFRFVFGDENLSLELKDYVFEQSKKNPVYLFHLAQNTFPLKPQVGFWGNILLETAGAPPETVDIKKAIMPIVNFARIYALKNALHSLNTIERIQDLQGKGILTDTLIRDIVQAFDVLSGLRLNRQSSLIMNNTTPDNLINTNTLSDLEKTIIKQVLSYINNMLAKLGNDFRSSA